MPAAGGAWPSLGGGGGGGAGLATAESSGAGAARRPRRAVPRDRAARHAAISARHSRSSRTLQRQAQTGEVWGAGGVQAGCGQGAGRAVRAGAYLLQMKPNPMTT